MSHGKCPFLISLAFDNNLDFCEYFPTDPEVFTHSALLRFSSTLIPFENLFAYFHLSFNLFKELSSLKSKALFLVGPTPHFIRNYCIVFLLCHVSSQEGAVVNSVCIIMVDSVHSSAHIEKLFSTQNDAKQICNSWLCKILSSWWQ